MNIYLLEPKSDHANDSHWEVSTYKHKIKVSAENENETTHLIHPTPPRSIDRFLK